MFSRASENTELLRKEKTEGESGRRRFYEIDKTHLADIFSLGGRRAASVSGTVGPGGLVSGKHWHNRHEMPPG